MIHLHLLTPSYFMWLWVPRVKSKWFRVIYDLLLPPFGNCQLSSVIIFWNPFLNHLDRIRETFWISFDANRLKINPTQCNSISFDSRLRLNESKRSFQSESIRARFNSNQILKQSISEVKIIRIKNLFWFHSNWSHESNRNESDWLSTDLYWVRFKMFAA